MGKDKDLNHGIILIHFYDNSLFYSFKISIAKKKVKDKLPSLKQTKEHVL